ncbi:ImmA/IrrE family metallo-endopeptidase [Priestia megaterium]
MQALVSKAKTRANEVRSALGLGNEPISDIFKILENKGIYLFSKPLTGNASAMFMRSNDIHLVIINSNKTLGHQIFSAAHELAHFLYDEQVMGGVCVVNKYNQDLEIEKLADLFASNFLMPEDGIFKHVDIRTRGRFESLSLQDILYLQHYFKVSWKAMLYRLFTLSIISKMEYERYCKVSITREASKYGYPTDLYWPDQKHSFSQKYIEKVRYAFDNYEISEKKMEEYFQDIDYVEPPEVDENIALKEEEEA